MSATKAFPSAYPADIVKLITTMAVHPNNIVLGGSSAIRAIAYPADYDAVDTGKNVSVKDFKEVVANLLTTKDCYIGDIKCGEVADWVVIPNDATVMNGKVVGYNATDARAKLNALKGRAISNAEYDMAIKLIKDNPTPYEFLTAKKEIRFHIVRWEPRDVLKGRAILRTGEEYSLEQGVKDKTTMMKCDVVGFVSNNRFTDFTMIYQRGAKLGDVANALKCDVLYYNEKGETFKALKRIFALARLNGNKGVIETALPILNGDLGILYSLKSDCDSLIYLSENADVVPIEKIHYEIDQFRSRISHLYEIAGLASREDTLLGEINSLNSLPSKRLLRGIERFRDLLMGLLHKYAAEEMKKAGLLPLPAEWLP
jgi:hypothetical protein